MIWQSYSYKNIIIDGRPNACVVAILSLAPRALTLRSIGIGETNSDFLDKIQPTQGKSKNFSYSSNMTFSNLFLLGNTWIISRAPVFLLGNHW